MRCLCRSRQGRGRGFVAAACAAVAAARKRTQGTAQYRLCKCSVDPYFSRAGLVPPLATNGNGGDAEPGMVLTWHGLSYSVPGRRRRQGSVRLLTDLTGFLLPGQFTALLGPSGCGCAGGWGLICADDFGRQLKRQPIYRPCSLHASPFLCWSPRQPPSGSKTTLLDCWAGRKTFGQMTGQVLYDGEPPTAALLRRHGELRSVQSWEVGAAPLEGGSAVTASLHASLGLFSTMNRLREYNSVLSWGTIVVGYVEQRDTLLPMLTPFEVRHGRALSPPVHDHLESMGYKGPAARAVKLCCPCPFHPACPQPRHPAPDAAVHGRAEAPPVHANGREAAPRVAAH